MLEIKLLKSFDKSCVVTVVKSSSKLYTELPFSDILSF